MKPEPPRNPEPLSAGAAERLGTIVEAAERAAQAVIDDAEAEARRYLEQTRAEADRDAAARAGELSRLIDSLLADAVALHEGAVRMVESLRRAREGLRAAGVDREHTEEDQGEPPLATVEELRPRQAEASTEHRPTVDEPEPDPPEPAPREPPRRGETAPAPARTPAGARLLATQLAVQGCSREEIDRRLRNGFEIEDTAAILDAILGPEE